MTASATVLERDGRDGVPDGFVELAAEAYRDDPAWIPEEPEAVRKAFCADNPWFERNEARVFCVPGKARAAAFVDPTCVVDGQRAAFFGYWESMGDAEANAAVLARAKAFAAERGATVLYGPINFTTYGAYRILLAAEEGHVPFPGEPYTPRRYEAEFEAMGLRLHQRYETHIGPVPKPAQAMLIAHLNQMRSAGYRFEPLTSDVWMENLREIHTLVDEIFGDNFAYTPLSFEVFGQAAGASLLAKACPRASVLAWGPEGDIAGLLLCYPDYGPIAAQGAGNARVPVGALRYDEHMPQLLARGGVDGLMKTVGTHPAHRRRGIQTALGSAALESAGDIYPRWIAPLIREGNPSGNPSRPFAQTIRYYGLFSTAIG